MTTAPEAVTLRVSDHIATVTLNRPEARNAVTTAMLLRLTEVFDAINGRDDIWCVVLAGAGPTFCAGADRNERAAMTDDDVRRRRRIAPAAFGAMRECDRPVIAQVQGHALGGGLELALNCDIVVAAAGTRMGLVETARASIPAGGGTQLLPRLIGVARAKELIFTSRVFTAEEALSWGMIAYVEAADALPARVAALAREIASVAPVANVLSKRAINRSLDVDVATGIQLEAALYERTFTTADRTEAFQAATQGRPPRYTGR